MQETTIVTAVLVAIASPTILFFHKSFLGKYRQIYRNISVSEILIEIIPTIKSYDQGNEVLLVTQNGFRITCHTNCLRKDMCMYWIGVVLVSIGALASIASFVLIFIGILKSKEFFSISILTSLISIMANLFGLLFTPFVEDEYSCHYWKIDSDKKSKKCRVLPMQIANGTD